MRVVFLGTPSFAVPTLRLLAGQFQVAGVVTQPDRPAGRGRRLRPSEVREAADQLGLPVHVSAAVSSRDTLEVVRAWAPEVVVVAAFGQILRNPLLELPPNGCLNLHASLLPRWRGASPVQHCLLHGDSEAGVTVMKMDPGLDSGPILTQSSIPTRADHTGDSLAAELAGLGADLMASTLPRWIDGAIAPQPQDDSRVTLAPRLSREDGRLDPEGTAVGLARRVRAFTSWPGTFLEWAGGRLAILEATALDQPGGAPPGTLLALGKLPALATADGLLALHRVQAPGKRPVSGLEFLRHRPDFPGSLTLPPARPGADDLR